MIRPILVLLLVSLAGAAEAQRRPQPKPPAPPSAWPIEKIQIEGLRDYRRETVLGFLGLKVGQTAGRKDFEAARDRLNATGAFAKIEFHYGPSPAGKGYIVTFELSEVEPKYTLRFEDLAVPDDQLRAALAKADPFFGPRVAASQPLLARYVKVVEECLAEHNKPQKVAGRPEPGDSGELQIVFEPASRPRVARVKFIGNSEVAELPLENAMNEVAVGMPYKEPRFRQLLDTQIRPLYDERGRVRATFPEIKTEPEKDVNGLLVTVRVDEGPSYTVGKVEVVGTNIAPLEWSKISGFKTGDVFNRDLIAAAAGRVEQRLRRQGRMHVQSQVERRIDDAAKRVNVVIHVTPGPLYTFGSLTIDGLDIISEPAIRKMWAMKEGEPFNADYPQHFLDGVREEGVLDNLGETRSLLKTNDQNRTVDVTLLFKGAPPPPKKSDDFGN
jgi:outer membrane protein insertion porin family